MSSVWWQRFRYRGAEPGHVPHPVDCDAVMAVIQRYLDGELVGGAGEVAAHLEACPGCEIEVATYQRLRAALARPAEDIDPDVLERLRRFGAELAGPD